MKKKVETKFFFVIKELRWRCKKISQRLSNFECTAHTHTHTSVVLLFIKFEAKAITKSTAPTKSNFTHLICFFFALQRNSRTVGERLLGTVVSACCWSMVVVVAAAGALWRRRQRWRQCYRSVAGSQLILIAVAVINGGSVTC